MAQEHGDSFYAPVVIPTLNRYVHLKRCVDSLAKCTGADKTILVISLDYPPSENYFEGYNRIKDYLPTIQGFRDVVVLEAEYNLGTVKNCRVLYDYVRGLGFDKYIFSEDDNEFSPNFLEYINKGLSLYERDEKVLMISGYSYPDICKMKNTNNVLAFRKAAAWGCGRWFHKEMTYVTLGPQQYRDAILLSWKKALRLFVLRPISLNSLISMKLRDTTYGDSLMVDCMLLENKYCVFPKISKVRNWGHDGTGEHCDVSDKYISHEIDACDAFEYDELKFYKRIPHERFNENDIINGVYKRIIIPFVVMTRFLFFRLTGKDLYYYWFEKK